MGIDPLAETCAAAHPDAELAVASFERLVRGSDDRVRAVVFRLVGDDVDDVMQTAYLRAFRSWSQFREASTPATWLHRIAVNTAMDHLRSRHRSVSLLGRIGRIGRGEDVATGVAAAVDLARAVDALPVDQRVTLLLIDGQGFSHENAAEVLGVAVGTIGSRLSRARRAVRTILEGGRP